MSTLENQESESVLDFNDPATLTGEMALFGYLLFNMVLIRKRILIFYSISVVGVFQKLISKDN